ncbi:MAG: hypothetical protein SOR74_09185 [Candidatus Faecivicinus sp.]|nr:hypothetical protein [Candidatus Faecivicinus sp.]
MKEFKDGLEDTAAKLQEGVDWAIAGAKSALKKAKPFIEDGLEMAKDGAQSLYERAKPTLDDLADRIKVEVKPEGEAQSGDTQPDVREEISREVDEQVRQIHEASVTPTPFSDYIRETYGKKDR